MELPCPWLMEGLGDTIIPSLSSFAAVMMTKFLVSYHTVTGWEQKGLWRKYSMKTRETAIRLPAPDLWAHPNLTRAASIPDPWGTEAPNLAPTSPRTSLSLKNPRPVSNHHGVVFLFLLSLHYKSSSKRGQCFWTFRGGKSDALMDFRLEILPRRLSVQRAGEVEIKPLCPFKKYVCLTQSSPQQTRVGFPKTHNMPSLLPRPWAITVSSVSLFRRGLAYVAFWRKKNDFAYRAGK